MNPNRLESISVREIGKVVDRFESMRQFLETNDKIPIWDGEIWLYNNVNHSNEYFKGKIPVQIKGTSVKRFSGKSIKYKLEKSHLQAYLKEHGTMFFVVEIINSDTTKIFFKSLLPVDIDEILKKMGKNKSKLEVFYELKEEEFELICRNFISDSGRQNKRLIQIGKSGMTFDSYTSSIIGNEELDIDQYLFNYGAYLYGKVPDYGIEIPIKKLIFDTKYEQIEMKVGMEDKVYYEYITIKKTKDERNTSFGESFRLISSSPGKFNINFKESGTLERRIKDTGFFIEVIKNKCLFINGSRMDISIPVEERKEMQSSFIDRLKELKEVQEAFFKINIKLEDDFSNYDKDIKKVMILRDIVLKRKDFSNIKKKDYHILTIGKFKILLVQGLGKYRNEIINIFDYDQLKEKYRIVVSQDEDFNKSAEHSIYTGFKVKDLFQFSNLNIDSIEQSLLEANYGYDFCFELTNKFLLQMLDYYDNYLTTSDNLRVLDMVANVFEYLEDRSDQDVLYFINKMQTLKRKRELTFEEKEEIIEMKEKHAKSETLKCAFHILLGHKAEFEVIFNKLVEEDRKTITEYPIYNLLQQ